MDGNQNYDEDAALRAAIAASMQTVKDDEERRHEKYGNIQSYQAESRSDAYQTSDLRKYPNQLVELPPQKSSQSLPRKNSEVCNATANAILPESNIARPRPQPGSTKLVGNNASSTALVNVVKMPPLSTFPPPLPMVGPNAKRTGDVRPRNDQTSYDRSANEMKTSTSSPQLLHQDSSLLRHENNLDSKPGNKKEQQVISEKPLISLSPNTNKPNDSFDYDVSSFDPLNWSSEDPFGNIHEAFGSKKPQLTDISVSPSVGLKYFPQQNNASSGTGLASKQQGGVNFGTGLSVNIPSASAFHASQQHSGTYSQSSHPFIAMTTGHFSQQSNLNLSGTVSVVPNCNTLQNFPVHPYGSLQQGQTLPSDAQLAIEGSAGANSVLSKSAPSAPTTLQLATQALPHAVSPSYTPSSSGTPVTPMSSNLIDFPEAGEIPLHEYMSLESFDPLYSLDQNKSPDAASPLSLGSTEERGIYTGDQGFHESLDSASKLGPKLVPVLQGQQSSEISYTTEGSGIIAQAPMPDVVQSATSNPVEDDFELQDPFSLSNLATAMRVLEEKRRKHAKEKEERSRLLRHQKETEIEKTTRREDRFHRTNSYLAKGKESSYESLQQFHETADEEIKSFCQMVTRLKKIYTYDEFNTNKGMIITPTLRHPPYKDLTVKLVIHTKMIEEPILFTCELNLKVSDVIRQVLKIITGVVEDGPVEHFVFQVFGLSEYLSIDSTLGDCEYVQECLKMDKDIKLVFLQSSDIPTHLLRTVEDDNQPVFVPKARMAEDSKITRDKLNILMETYYKNVENLRDQVLQNGFSYANSISVVQSVKALCAVLCKIETIDIIKAVERLLLVTQVRRNYALGENKSVLTFETESGEIVRVQANEISRITELDDLHTALDDLTQSVKGLIELFCRTFHTDFRFESATNLEREKKSLSEVNENLIVHVASVHMIPVKWRTSYEEFKIICGLYYGGRKICEEVTTQMNPSKSQGSFQETMIFDEWVIFENILLSELPRETRMTFTLVGVKTVTTDDKKKGQKINTPLGWVALQVFNHKFELVQGHQLLGLWIGESANPFGTSLSNTEFPNSILLQVNMPDFEYDVTYTCVERPNDIVKEDFTSLPMLEIQKLEQILAKDTLTRLNKDELELVWLRRLYLCNRPEALAKVLQAATLWDPTWLQHIYTIVHNWTPLMPIQALELLLPMYADTHIRMVAMNWIKELRDDELYDFLPQLIQGLKFESYHNSSLARFLLERAVINLRIAHSMYWLLKEAAEDSRHRKRYQLMFGALLSVVGAGVRKELSKQEDFVRMISAIADKVKAAKDKESVLHRELANMFDFLHNESIRLPLNPSMEIFGVDTKSCSYFTSNAFPLKLVLQNIDPSAEPIYVMFKAGDDLRQDMLTMQMIRIMDKLWLAEGLDLKLITFRCQATGQDKGLIELVTESETLRKIHMKHGHGLAGSFKDTPIAEWLQVQNPTELEYQKAVHNFIASCAGYCVATYVLGICDRHNDNIMITQSGHMFHIDFGKFLGDSQMFGSIKRDRTPFVLTSDMAYVINGGDKASHNFQLFVDLCSSAFNILRKQSSLFLNLFSLMVLSKIPGVNEHATKYVQQALMPNLSNIEAIAYFTRMIEDSLKSLSTQINFFFHNLAQMKFSGHSEGALLSFVPKTYSLNTDGRIVALEVFGYQKRYNPEKHYVYIIKVDRESQKVPSFIFRRYSEFVEFQQKLCYLFPLARITSLHGRVLLGRTHVQSVAQSRKNEVQKFIKTLLLLQPEVADCDLVYTFFHPMLRDEQDIDKTNLQKLKEKRQDAIEKRTIQGHIKFATFYHKTSLTIMIMHVKGLCGESGDAPDAYVKTYLQPDPMKFTKRKTKVVKGTFHPTFNEPLVYRIPFEEALRHVLQVTVWNCNSLEENEFLGGVLLPIHGLDLTTEQARWYELQMLHMVSS